MISKLFLVVVVLNSAACHVMGGVVTLVAFWFLNFFDTWLIDKRLRKVINEELEDDWETNEYDPNIEVKDGAARKSRTKSRRVPILPRASCGEEYPD
jgi:hypothetical protein